MPYELLKSETPRGWFVIKKGVPSRKFSKEPHPTKKAATEQMKALYAAEAREIKKKK